ncbi:MAG TPA: bifunctional 3-(3-hydroxy-phenyl)propionate/3-hydroxycinnamic acid hydroxylase [Caulobacteraceae bacterium]
MTRRDVFDVAIVGLGPVGAALAALLSRAGVSICVAEKDGAIYPLPRAAHFDHEIMRLFQRLGIAELVLEEARPATGYRFENAAGQVLMEFDMPPGASPSGWSPSYMFHQPAMERALRGLLTDVDVRLGRRFESLAQDADGVTLTLADPEGATETVRAGYLIGCDGGGSAVRRAISGVLDDYGFDEPWLVIDVRVGEGARLPDINLQICDPARPTTCVLMGPGRHRWEFMLKPGEDPAEALDDDAIAAWLAPWGGFEHLTLERKAVYRFHGLVARSWRSGRVFLAGDAAHQMPPFLGQGLCSGLRDAANLAWKLAAVALGEAPPALLETYEPERAPNVRAIVEQAIFMGRVVCATDPEAARARDLQMIADRESGAAPPRPPGVVPVLSQGCILAGAPAAGQFFPQPWSGDLRLDDFLGEGPVLITRAPQAGLGVRSIDLDGPDLAPFRAALTLWLERHGAQAVLVRPDRFVFGAGEPRVLADAWRTLACQPAPA